MDKKNKKQKQTKRKPLRSRVIKEILNYLELPLPAVRNSPVTRLPAHSGRRKHLDFWTVHRGRLLSSTVENLMTHLN